MKVMSKFLKICLDKSWFLGIIVHRLLNEYRGNIFEGGAWEEIKY